MRTKTIYRNIESDYWIEQIDGGNSFHVSLDDTWLDVFHTLSGAQRFIARKLDRTSATLTWDVITSELA